MKSTIGTIEKIAILNSMNAEFKTLLFVKKKSLHLKLNSSVSVAIQTRVFDENMRKKKQKF